MRSEKMVGCAPTSGQVPGLALLEGLEGAAEGSCHLGLGPQALAGNQVRPAGMCVGECGDVWAWVGLVRTKRGVKPLPAGQN
jgi:hypothetical protein